jgi:hypothetical protein
MQNLIAVDPSTVHNSVCKAACTPGQPCYLHLHGASSWVRGATERPSVYSSQSAPGLVMASGALCLAFAAHLVVLTQRHGADSALPRVPVPWLRSVRKP